MNIISSAPIVMPFTTASSERVTLICSTSDAVKLDFHEQVQPNQPRRRSKRGQRSRERRWRA